MLLEFEGVGKSFPGARALDDVSFTVRACEVHALLGENGAGKSTLLKILAGAQPADSGTIRLDGVRLDPHDTPRRRQKLGIVTIYQEFNLANNLSVAENMFMGREPLRAGLVDWARMRAGAEEILSKLGGGVSPNTTVRDLSVADQQLVEIARALTLDARLIVMDEPTAALSVREVDRLHRVIEDLKRSGVAVIYVTHRLDEVKDICDRYTVLRDGRVVAQGQVQQAQVGDFVRAMVGRDLSAPPPRTGRRGEIVLEAHFGGRDVSLYAGEIVGMAGLVGAGRTEFARAIFGAAASDGELVLNAKRRAPFASPAEAVRHGVVMAPEDRKAQGCFLSHSLLWNLTLPSLARLARLGFIDGAAERVLANGLVARLNIRAASTATLMGSLSGGHQQKAMFARSAALNPRVFIVDEPTRGVDVGAKAEVHQIMFDLAAAGIAILAISSDLPELMQISDRIVVMHAGAVVGEAPLGAGEEELMLMMTGQAQRQSA